MRLSDAIRLGSTLRPHGRGRMLSAEGATCAGGAALDAIGKLDWDSTSGDVADHFPIWLKVATKPGGTPRSMDVYGPNGVRLGTLVVWLNDTCHWTREAIADWVEEVELFTEQEGRQDKEEEHEPALA